MGDQDLPSLWRALREHIPPRTPSQQSSLWSSLLSSLWWQDYFNQSPRVGLALDRRGGLILGPPHVTPPHASLKVKTSPPYPLGMFSPQPWDLCVCLGHVLLYHVQLECN